ncbi:FliG C-terminal domain-containing protein [Croceibacterium sp. TMG7-5b_MA50]|uniref:flagellar motor switch protein FliG n=1 Tax=Croceibacterium sp. TMG7-5b_MA50 TaxID=3121290 RepID=UPI003221CE71
MSEVMEAAPVRGADRAAVMVMLLEEKDATGLIGRLSQEELRTLGSRMLELGEIGPDAIIDAIAAFAGEAGQGGIPAFNRMQEVRQLMTGALGDLRAGSLMRQVAPDALPPPTPALEIARWLEPDVLVPLIAEEPPQVIAVLLVQLDAGLAAKVLALLPDAVQVAVVHRIARLGNVPAPAIALLEETLSARLERIHGVPAHRMGGVRDAAGIINSAARSLERRVMPAITKVDKQLARDLENELFRFEHLFGLDPRMMGALLREVESEVLIDALKGIDEAQRDVFFAAMSSRAADGVRDEIEERGRLKRADVEDAQKKIIATAKRLAAEGTIVLGDGEEDYV